MSTFQIHQKRKLKLSDRRGANNPNWKGGVFSHVHDGRYNRVLVYSPNHPRKTNQNYVLRARLVMEKHLGRYLNKGEVVHHINGITDDDRIENLQVMNARDHISHHSNALKRLNKWSRLHNECFECGTVDIKHHGHGLCKVCYASEIYQSNKAKGLL